MYINSSDTDIVNMLETKKKIARHLVNMAAGSQSTKLGKAVLRSGLLASGQFLIAWLLNANLGYWWFWVMFSFASLSRALREAFQKKLLNAMQNLDLLSLYVQKQETMEKLKQLIHMPLGAVCLMLVPVAM